MKPIQLATLLRKYEDQWVALNKARTEVLGFGQSIEDALNLARKKTSDSPIMMYVPRLDLDYVG